MSGIISVRFQVAGHTASDWAAIATVPLEREVCVETDTRRLKIGDGVNAYSALSYVDAATLGGHAASYFLAASALGTGVATALAINVGSAGAFVVLGGAGGTPSSLTLTHATGLPIGTGVSGLGTGVATFLATPSSANLAAAITDETGSGALVFGTAPTISTLTVSTGGVAVTGISSFSAAVNFNGALQAVADNRNFLNLYDGGAGATLANIGPQTFTNHAGAVRCVIDGSGIAPLSTTTASAANVFQSGTGTVLLRSTSSARYKKDIRELPDADADKVLRLRPVIYRSKASADDGRRKHWGLIAEEVAGHLKPLVHFNEEGEPESVQYERVVVGLLSVVKREQSARLALEDRVAALEALRAP